MSRTKEEMVKIISQRLISKHFASSDWGHLVGSIQGATNQQKNKLVGLIVQNRNKEVGEMLSKALLQNAEERAEAEVDAILADDVINLQELNELI